MKTNEENFKEILKEILKAIDKKVEKPFITARFGEHWKEHTKKEFEEEEVDIDSIINIAWKQGRKAILLEEVLYQYIKNQFII